MQRTAPAQSPMPVDVGGRLTLMQRIVVGAFVLALALVYLLPVLMGLPGTP